MNDQESKCIGLREMELSAEAEKQLEKMLNEPSNLKIKAQSLQAYKDGDYLTSEQFRQKLMNEYVVQETGKGACSPYPLPDNTHLILSERPMGGDWFKVKIDSIDDPIDNKWMKSNPNLNQIDKDEYNYYWIARENDEVVKT